MIYLTAIGLTPGGSSTVHIYTKTIHRTTKSTQTIRRTTQSTQTIRRITQSTQTIRRTTQLTKWEECGPCPVLCELYPGICLTTEEKPQSG